MRDTDLELCDAVCDYLENPDRLKSISETLSEEFSGNATEYIYEYVLSAAGFKPVTPAKQNFE